MSSAVNKKSSNKATSIFVAINGRGVERKVKILFPRSLEALKKSVAGIFCLKKPIIGFYSNDDFIIEDIHDIEPESLVYASTSAKEMETKKRRTVITQNKFVNEEFATEIKFSPHQSEDESSLSYDDDLSDLNEENQVFNQKETEKNEEVKEEENKKVKKVKSHIPVAKKRRKHTHKEQKNEEVEKGKEEEISPETEGKSCEGDNKSNQSNEDKIDAAINEDEIASDDELQEENKTVIKSLSDSQENDEIEEEKEEEEETKETLLFDVIEEIIGENSKEAAENAYNCLPTKVRDFYDTALAVEEQQNFRYMTRIEEILKSESFINDNEIKFKEEIDDKIMDFISDHTVSSGNGVSYNFHAALFGPKNSGKTTLLGLLVKQLALELAARGMNKNYFIFFINMNSILFSTRNIKDFYKWYVSRIFNLIFAQSPIQSKWKETLITNFSSIVDSRGAYLSKTFISKCEDSSVVSRVRQVFETLKQSWNAKEYNSKWISDIIDMPREISKAFGFNEVMFVLDHFDSAVDMEDDSSIQFPMLFMKLISHSPFVIGTEDSDKAASILSDSFDTSYETITTLDTVNLNDKYTEIRVFFEDENLGKLTMKANSAGGVPLFVAKWKEIIKEFDKLDEIDVMEEDGDVYDDQLVEIIALVETYICLTYKLDSFSVSNVIRQ